MKLSSSSDVINSCYSLHNRQTLSSIRRLEVGERDNLVSISYALNHIKATILAATNTSNPWQISRKTNLIRATTFIMQTAVRQQMTKTQVIEVGGETIYESQGTREIWESCGSLFDNFGDRVSRAGLHSWFDSASRVCHYEIVWCSDLDMRVDIRPHAQSWLRNTRRHLISSNRTLKTLILSWMIMGYSFVVLGAWFNRWFFTLDSPFSLNGWSDLSRFFYQTWLCLFITIIYLIACFGLEIALLSGRKEAIDRDWSPGNRWTQYFRSKCRTTCQTRRRDSSGMCPLVRLQIPTNG